MALGRRKIAEHEEKHHVSLELKLNEVIRNQAKQNLKLNLIIQTLKQIKMTHEELLTEISAIATQLNKGIAEVIAALAKVPNVPQAVVDKLAEVKTSVQQLDDLNADAEPEPEV